MSTSSSLSNINSASISSLASSLVIGAEHAKEIRSEIAGTSLDDQISALIEKYKNLGNARKTLSSNPEDNWPWLIEMFELKARIKNLTNQKSEQEQKQLSDILIGKSISSPTEKAASAARENAADNLYFYFAQEIKKHLAILAQFNQSKAELMAAKIALGKSQEVDTRQIAQIKQLHEELGQVKREREIEKEERIKASKIANAKIKRSCC